MTSLTIPNTFKEIYAKSSFFCLTKKIRSSIFFNLNFPTSPKSSNYMNFNFNLIVKFGEVVGEGLGKLGEVRGKLDDPACKLPLIVSLSIIRETFRLGEVGSWGRQVHAQLGSEILVSSLLFRSYCYQKNRLFLVIFIALVISFSFNVLKDLDTLCAACLLVGFSRGGWNSRKSTKSSEIMTVSIGGHIGTIVYNVVEGIKNILYSINKYLLCQFFVGGSCFSSVIFFLLSNLLNCIGWHENNILHNGSSRTFKYYHQIVNSLNFQWSDLPPWQNISKFRCQPSPITLTKMGHIPKRFIAVTIHLFSSALLSVESLFLADVCGFRKRGARGDRYDC